VDPHVLIDFARIKPLAAWSIADSVLGAGLALYLSSWHIVAPLPMAMAIIVVILIQWVAHPLNDILDYDLDRKAPIEETARIKPIVDGRISMNETKWLTRGMLVIILAIMAYLVLLQPILVLPAAYGVGAMLGYSSSRLRLAYRPFTEFYLGIPINTISITVISYIGSGQLSWIAVIVGVVYAFATSSFFLSMMSMDFPTDRTVGKRTTIVSFPWIHWCTYYPSIGLAIALVSAPFFYLTLGVIPALLFIVPSALVFTVLIMWGSQVDELRLRFLKGLVPDPEGRSGTLRLGQLYAATVFGFVLGALFAFMGA
jgi:1,4-dihydroxy-2-naphthoate octaprenyltransferase